MSEEEKEIGVARAIHDAYKEGYRKALALIRDARPDDVASRLQSMRPLIPSIYGPLIDQACALLRSRTITKEQVSKAEMALRDAIYEKFGVLHVDGDCSAALAAAKAFGLTIADE